MAKTTKSGLGRGLDSLLGEQSEEDKPVEPSPARERIFVDSELPTSYGTFSTQKDTSSQTTTGTKREEVSKSKPTQNEQPAPSSFLASRSFYELPIDSVSPNPDQPRTNFDQEAIDELAASIKQEGLLQPILVRPVSANEYQIIAGERRWQACKVADLEKIPAIIKEVDDDAALELALVENVQRTDLNPMEEAYGYKRLMDRKHMTQADVAQSMAKGRSTVANALRLLELPEQAQHLLFEDKISAGHARAILSVPTQEGRQTLTDKLIETKMSVRETESYARLLSGKNRSQSTKQPTPETYKTVAKALHDVLNTNVRIKTSNGKNKIEIEFKDEDELKKLFEELLASVS